MDDICYRENIYRTTRVNIPLSPTLANKQAIEEELNIDGGKPVLPCF